MTNPLTKIKEFIWEQEEVVKIRQQFSELDAKTQSYVIFSAIGVGTAALLGLLIFLFATTHGVRSEMADMDDSIRSLNQASDKMNDLRQKIQAQSVVSDDLELDAQTPLTDATEKVAGKSGIGKDSLEPGADQGSAYEVKLNKISLRQLQRFLFYFENSKAGATVQHIFIETRDDPEGYLWAVVKLVREVAKAVPAAAGAKK